MTRVAKRYLNTVYLDEKEFRDLTESSIGFQPAFNPFLFKQLEYLRSQLDEQYFGLLQALRKGERLKVRKRFFRFNDTLSTYVKQNRIELYDYLEDLYKQDRQKRFAVEVNRSARDKAVETISNTMAQYVSPSAVYDDGFERKMRSIWVLLKWRYQQERESMYPLYPTMLESA